MEFKDSSRRKEFFAAFSFLLFSVTYLGVSLRLKGGTASNPGPGFLPVIVGVLLSACSVILLFRLFKSEAKTEAAVAPLEPTRQNQPSIAGIFACTIVYPFALEILGFFLSTATTVFIMFLLLNPRRPFRAFYLSIGSAAVSFFVFSVLLGVAFPFGVLDEFFYHLIGG
jgi:hypothetical protein